MKWEHNSPRSADMVISLSLVIRRLGSGKANNSIYEIKIKKTPRKKIRIRFMHNRSKYQNNEKKKYNYQNWLDKSYDKELEKNIKTGRKKKTIIMHDFNKIISRKSPFWWSKNNTYDAVKTSTKT